MRFCTLIVLAALFAAPSIHADDAALIEADWRKQDGILTARKPATFAEATEITLRRGDALLADLGQRPREWQALHEQYAQLNQQPTASEKEWETLWRRVHQERRRIILSNPLLNTGPLLFIKQAPGTFSHQLTQVYGRYARPGGGIFILDKPGESLSARQLAPAFFPEGSFQTPEVSYDGRQILFAFCTTDASRPHARYYHLYRMSSDGRTITQLTDGDFDDFSPRFLPNGQIVFVTTRRGGFHRCGSPGCPVYTLAVMDADGSNVRLLSRHETQEWDPAVLHDGRIIYTRWDYVDRHAVFGEHLWTTRPDGTSPAAFYGNYTRNPIGIWEPQPIPGSDRVMATAAAHHAMTAGSIVLVDPRVGQDGHLPLTRLTPDTPFPESEFAVGGRWHFPSPDNKPADSIENQRWPGHCYRSPWPLSEKHFIAAYSFDALVGEPDANPAAMFGLYVVDAFGNKELIHRDPAISSLWAIPLRPRAVPPELPPVAAADGAAEGTFFLANVYASDPPLPPKSVKRLRIVQVLPKTTQGRDNPPVGAAGGSPGKAVLGTVPVDEDGSAHFRAPAKVPLLFQALDEHGRAVQVMRSATYLQPGETMSCAGCHEPRNTAPPSRRPAALSREPSAITPGPDGSRPFSYPRLVQGMLDKHCIACHSRSRPDGNLMLTSEPEGHYTVSYNALVKQVPYSNDTNGDSLSTPGRYGARGSPVMTLLLTKDHYGVKLSPEEIERLATWMDTNALFYGTFDPSAQARQRKGEAIPFNGLE